MPKRFTSPDRCRGKIPYDSRGEAKNVLRRGHFKSSVAGNFRVYTCNVCGFFHVGSTGKTGDRRDSIRNSVMGKKKKQRPPKKGLHNQSREGLSPTE
jgi:hypothetical protein